MKNVKKKVQKFYYRPDIKPHKSNKLKVGDHVKPTTYIVDWYVNHLVWLFSASVGNNEREILQEDRDSVLFWLCARRNIKTVTGIIKGYGADELDDGPKKPVHRKNVFVELEIKVNSLGKLQFQGYFAESHLKRVR